MENVEFASPYWHLMEVHMDILTYYQSDKKFKQLHFELF